jgi:beta-glucosidase
MKKLSLCNLFFFILLNLSAQSIFYKSANHPVEERVNDLLKRMTLSEKLGQLTMPAIFNDSTFQLIQQNASKGTVSTICVVRTFDFTTAKRNKLQKIAIENSRLGIPILFAFDVIHGYKTIFPIPLGLSASWDPDLVFQTARAAAREASVSGIDLTFSPMVDVARDARWGRISEGSGEDVLLNCRFAKAMVEGYQGKDLTDKYSIGACLKHFVGYGASTGGRDYQFTELSERALRETYLPPFHAGVDAGAVSVMSAFNDISGVPAAANAFTLNDVLRKEWGFKGFVMSDWGAVDELKEHGIAGTNVEAASTAISAGTDVEMTSNCYADLAKEVKEKHFSEKIIDEAVRRVLRTKFRLGLFEQPYTEEGNELNEILNTNNRTLARKAAAESMVLLKNDGILPIKENSGVITVLGEWANNQDLMGWWTGNGDRKDVISIIEGLKGNEPKGVKVIHTADPQELNANTVIVCVGESGNMFGEYHSRSELDLPWGQTEQIRQLKESGKKVIVVIFNGRPLVLTEVVKYADAILLAWHPGTEAGNAVADILYGKVNPSGKLTVSFPKKTGQVPIFYSQRTSGRPDKSSYIDVNAEPLYPFGFGLSYTTFTYKNISLSKGTIAKNESVKVSFDVTNSGNVKGKEVLELYLHDRVASITQPVKKLIDFQKVEIEPGEIRRVTFTITPEQLAILDKNLKLRVESGTFDLYIGQCSVNYPQISYLTTQLTVK